MFVLLGLFFANKLISEYVSSNADIKKYFDLNVPETKLHY